MNTVYVTTFNFLVGKKQQSIEIHSYTEKRSSFMTRFLRYVFSDMYTLYSGKPAKLISYYTQQILTETDNIASPYFTSNYINSLLDEEQMFFDDDSVRLYTLNLIIDIYDLGITFNNVPVDKVAEKYLDYFNSIINLLLKNQL